MQHINTLYFSSPRQSHINLLQDYLPDVIPSPAGRPGSLTLIRRDEQGATYLVKSSICYHAEVRLVDDGVEVLLDCLPPGDDSAQYAEAIAFIETYVVLSYLRHSSAKSQEVRPMSIIPYTFRYDEMEPRTTLEILLRTLANTHIPRPPDAPALVAISQRPECYEFLCDGHPGMRRVTIKPLSEGVKIELEAGNDQPEELLQAVIADAAREILRHNHWPQHRLYPYNAEIATYIELGAVDGYNAIVALVSRYQETLEEEGFDSQCTVEPTSDTDLACQHESKEVIFGSTWIRMEVKGSVACNAVTVYFYPDYIQVMVEGLYIDDPRCKGWLVWFIQLLLGEYLCHHYPELEEAQENDSTIH